MKVLNGQLVAQKIISEIQPTLTKLNEIKVQPNLAVIAVGANEVSEKYIQTKTRQMTKLGLEVKVYRLDKTTTQAQCIELIDYLNRDPEIHGILVQLPLPNGLEVEKIVSRIRPEKDVDGFSMIKFNPPAPAAIIDLLDYYKIPIEQERVLLVGFGRLVGQPVKTLLEERGAIVEISTKTTNDLVTKMKTNNIIITAVGQPKLITSGMVDKDQIIVDAGTASEGNSTVGDVDFEPVSKIVTAISPVPGGIGPITVAQLARNVVWAAQQQTSGKN
jgi:methylenetetrahydrofolate dehydrogenase (NADP+)/methenyltetrahydrofolate cyclohydrolase